MGGAQAGAMGLNDPRGRPDRVFRIRKEGTGYGDDDDQDDEYTDDTALFTIWNRYIDEESQEAYYYNTSTGDTSFKPPPKIRDMLEKEMEEKALLESGSDLPEELRVYAAQVEADAEERRMAAFKKEQEEEAAEAKRLQEEEAADRKRRKALGEDVEDYDEFEDADRRREKARVQAEVRKKNATIRQKEMIEWIEENEIKLRFYDVFNRLLPTESRFHETMYKDPGEVTDEELATMYKFQNDRETRWEIEERAAIKLQLHWRIINGGFHVHIRKQAQLYADEHKRKEEKKAKAIEDARKKQKEIKDKKFEAKLKRQSMSSEDKVNRLIDARARLREADEDENINAEELLRDLLGEDAHTDLSSALTNDQKGQKPPEKTFLEKMKQALIMMEGKLYKTCFLGWKDYTRECVFYRKALHHELSVRFHRWHFNAHHLRKLRTRMQKVTVTFYFENIHWAFHRWYMRTRINFDIRHVTFNGETHRVLVMRGDLSKRDSDGTLGMRCDHILLPKQIVNTNKKQVMGNLRLMTKKEDQVRNSDHVYW